MRASSSSPRPVDASCAQSMFFPELGSRRVEADFSAGHVSTDGGWLLLRQVDQSLGLSRTLATCFHDRRDQNLTTHSVRELLAQRIFGLAAGYEDLNDHDRLRTDPLFAVAAGKVDPLGLERTAQNQGKALASSATLNRLELSSQLVTGLHKIHAQPAQIEATLLRLGVRGLDKHARAIIIDLDASDDPLHGQQVGRFFHGDYGHYCYLQLFAFVRSIPVWADCRPA